MIDVVFFPFFDQKIFFPKRRDVVVVKSVDHEEKNIRVVFSNLTITSTIDVSFII